ncbi:MAG TPA: hypothetical protein VHB68_13450 [Steroidobacteraceae bacterium]|nr:hypothetical protein [Steroidobacteraceae bacterium]
MAWVRTWHTYFGILIAPSVLFFALTGALQLFGLHEAHGAYHPPALVEKLGRLHKDQVFALGERHETPPPQAAGEPPKKDAEDEDSAGTLILKGYFLIVALGLIASTGMGLYMGLTHIRRKRTGWVLLAAGIAIPLALVIV